MIAWPLLLLLLSPMRIQFQAHGFYFLILPYVFLLHHAAECSQLLFYQYLLVLLLLFLSQEKIHADGSLSIYYFFYETGLISGPAHRRSIGHLSTSKNLTVH